MSTAKKLILGLAGLGLSPSLARAQSVVVRHVVQAEVLPLASVRDSGWVRVNPDDESASWVWSGELRSNTASELQVLGPDADEPAARIRVGSGPWIRLQPRVWNGVWILAAGKQHIAIEYSPGTSLASGPPDVRIR